MPSDSDSDRPGESSNPEERPGQSSGAGAGGSAGGGSGGRPKPRNDSENTGPTSPDAVGKTPGSIPLGSDGTDDEPEPRAAARSNDLSDILQAWPYEPGKLSARLIMGEDGEPRLQIRMDLGVLQMHLEGRPDGQRPRGFESLLEFHETRLDEHHAEHQGSDEGFALSPDDCRELREEAVQYYQRYTGLLVMEDFDGVVRDTSRNLRVLDLTRNRADESDDRNALEQFRPFILMTRARALASQAMRENEPKAALLAVDDGLEALRKHFADGPDGAFESSQEAQMLRQMRDTLLPRQPLSARGELKKRLTEALGKENYELAAILRDKLKALKDE